MSHTFWRVSRVELSSFVFCFFATIYVAPNSSTLTGCKVEGKNNEAQRASIKPDGSSMLGISIKKKLKNK